MKNILKHFWLGWKRFARAFGAMQAEIIFFLFYFLIFTPFGLILKIFRYDPLHRRLKGAGNWQDTQIGSFDKERARHQS